MIRKLAVLAALGAAAGLAACAPSSPSPSTPPATALPPTPPPPMTPADLEPQTGPRLVVDAWIGRWIGPEGTYLDISRSPRPGAYALEFGGLDGVEKVEGLVSLDTIIFPRGGAQVALRAATGDETGMKWLAGKTNCLMTTPGEGWCL